VSLPRDAGAAEASFDCARAQSDSEWAICNTPTLAAWDVRMAALYAQRSAQDGVRAAQRAWIYDKRDACGGNVACLMTAYELRLQELEGPKGQAIRLTPVRAARLSNACRPDQLTILDTGLGDAGMSKATRVYLIRYTGSGSCVLRGYPALTVQDRGGAVQTGYPNYTTAGYFVRFPGRPETVTLSGQSRDAWFSLSTSTGCAPRGGTSGLSVDVALPLSTKALKRIALPGVTCEQVSVTPVAPASIMKDALSP
jgi:hypothetical protein